MAGQGHAWGRPLHNRGQYGDKGPAALRLAHLKGLLLSQYLAPAPRHALQALPSCYLNHGYQRGTLLVQDLPIKQCQKSRHKL